VWLIWMERRGGIRAPGAPRTLAITARSPKRAKILAEKG
jgi:hypothetical protein